MFQMFTILGTLTADLFVLSDVLPGQTSGDGFTSSNLLFTNAPLQITVGGNGGNSAYVLAGLGAPTSLCSAVGRDLLGDMLVDRLQARGVNLDGLHRSATHATSSSTIIMGDAENQIVYHHLGSTALTSLDTIPNELLTAADALLISSYPIMTGLRPDGFGHALAVAHAAGAITALDIGPAIGDPVTLAEITPILPHIDYLIANIHELTSLTAISTWPDAAARLLSAGAGTVIIKQAEAGAAAWSKTEHMHVPAFQVAANISVGAGDAFNAGFLYALQQDRPFEAALRFANAVAALVVSSEQGISGSPGLVEVEAFLRSHPG